jgi:hypothetical protein
VVSAAVFFAAGVWLALWTASRHRRAGVSASRCSDDGDDHHRIKDRIEMTIVDDRGRVGGRFNLIDVIAAIAILLLLPVAFGAYLLFRTPPAKLRSIEPVSLHQGPNLRIVVSGTNLRPFMRVSFNAVQGRDFMIAAPTWAQVDLPDLPAGVYDIGLFDNGQLLDRLPKALTILSAAPTPTVELMVSGSFTGLGTAAVQQIRPGLPFPAGGEPNAVVVSVGAPEPAHVRLHAGAPVIEIGVPGQSAVPAVLRVKCYLVPDAEHGGLRCMMSGPVQAATVAPDSVLTLAAPQGWVNFQITDVKPTPAR